MVGEKHHGALVPRPVDHRWFAKLLGFALRETSRRRREFPIHAAGGGGRVGIGKRNDERGGFRANGGPRSHYSGAATGGDRIPKRLRRTCNSERRAHIPDAGFSFYRSGDAG